MKDNLLNFGAFLLLYATFFTSCKKVTVVEDNDNEVITTLLVRLTATTGGAFVDFKFDDPDGPGGAAPTIDQINLAPNKTYNAQIILLNKTATPVDTSSIQVKEENIAHRFYFETTIGTNLTISNLDKDDDGISLGLLSTWTTGAASTGKIGITLRHYDGIPPNKAEADLISSSKSSTDLTTASIGDFSVNIQ